MIDSEVNADGVTGPGDGVMAIVTKTEKGFTLTREFGFTVEEENEKVIAFDLLEHPQMGITILFGNQVFALKFWDEEDLYKGVEMFSQAIRMELERREELESEDAS